MNSFERNFLIVRATCVNDDFVIEGVEGDM